MTATTARYFDYSVAQNLLKNTYADSVEDMVPESDKIAKELEFIAADKQPGLQYNMPVTISREMGATFNNDGSVFQLNKPLSRTELNATIQGNEFVLRSAMSYGILNRALKGDVSTTAGKRAFVSATKDTMQALTKSASFFREAQLLYGGGSGVGATLATVASITTQTGTSLVIGVAAADWATALWVGSEGGEYDIYSSGGTKRNTAGTVGDTVYKLTAANPAVGVYSLSFTSHATNVSAVATTDQVFFAGARAKEALGIVGACQTSGSLWGINTTSYNLWQPKTSSVGGSLTFERIMQGVSKVADIGFVGTINVHVSPNSWQDINDDQAALVRHGDKAGGEVSLGYEEISFYGQTGKINIKPNIYIKRGIAVGLPEGYGMRVGSSDITFTMPGYGKMMRELEDYAGVETRMYWDQAFFCKAPAYMHLWTGITNTAD